ncbi:MAG: AmmeMemoRadiSam system radical SAM enzyme [Acholeplasmataceae bacterium]|nr:AmmeMemoRadiSam system radical SAM enzyme [Acholeplasmataceae bacterium]
MMEAMLYSKRSNNSVVCRVCSLHCLINDGERGICGVRENVDGTLYVLNYEKAIAMAIDPIEKKPIYHFLQGTKTYSFAAVGCNMVCPWCQNWSISQGPKPDKYVNGISIAPEEHVNRAIRNACPSIAYTYSEPTVFLEYALDTMKIARDKGLKNIWVSNGIMSKETLNAIIPYLDAANIDYKGPDDEMYEKYCGGKATQVMKNMKQLQEAGIHLEVTTLIIPGINDQREQILEIAQTLVSGLGQNVPWHISRFFPAWQMENVAITPLDTLIMAYDIGKDAGMKTIHIGNI